MEEAQSRVQGLFALWYFRSSLAPWNESSRELSFLGAKGTLHSEEGKYQGAKS